MCDADIRTKGGCPLTPLWGLAFSRALDMSPGVLGGGSLPTGAAGH